MVLSVPLGGVGVPPPPLRVALRRRRQRPTALSHRFAGHAAATGAAEAAAVTAAGHVRAITAGPARATATAAAAQVHSLAPLPACLPARCPAAFPSPVATEPLDSTAAPFSKPCLFPPLQTTAENGTLAGAGGAAPTPPSTLWIPLRRCARPTRSRTRKRVSAGGALKALGGGVQKKG